MSRYYAVGLVVVVQADSADDALEAVTPREANVISEDDAYLGVVFAAPACPITLDMAREPDWTVELYYSSSGDDIASGRALPLMDGD